ncbi:MAG: hypothetical protein EXS16_13695 [Gemmataceae bacterium]|nr:hypothetical protein [Gemmataceae bacterium]
MLMSVAGNGCAINQFYDDQQGNSDRKMFEFDEYRQLRREMQNGWNSSGGNQSQGSRIPGGVAPAASSI